MAKKLSRREFIQGLIASASMAPMVMSMQNASSNGIPTRPLGNTGEKVSIIGYGGWDSVVKKTDKESIQLMHEALDAGITFWDNAWEYNNGRSEEVMGKALQESSNRKKVFLMTKVCARDYIHAREQLEDSLTRLRTDHLDLWQFHSLQYEGDVERVMDPENGAIRAAIEAKKAGKIRYIGFTGHMYPELHLKMLGKDFQWDSVQMPLNILDAHYKSFQHQVLPIANQKKIGTLGMKSLAGQNARIHRELNVNVQLLRRYTLSLPISSLICGIQTREELLSDIEVARNFKPFQAEEIDELLAIAKEPAQDGEIELYKNPEGYFGCSYHSKVLRASKE